MTLYRIDYMPDHGSDHVDVIYAQGRADALAKARRLSRTHGSVYVIRTSDGRDTGQRVYHHGYFSHDDDQF